MTVVVGAALFDTAGRLLAAQRDGPRSLAGWWEFPGGKVEPGEDDVTALVRECREELGVEIAVDGALGAVPLPGGAGELRVLTGRVVVGEPRAIVHRALRWLAAGELGDVPWLPADLPLVEEIRRRADSL